MRSHGGGPERCGERGNSTAGGPTDKNWLILRALSAKEGGDLAAAVEPVFGAPPLIGEQLKPNGRPCDP